MFRNQAEFFCWTTIFISPASFSRVWPDIYRFWWDILEPGVVSVSSKNLCNLVRFFWLTTTFVLRSQQGLTYWNKNFLGMQSDFSVSIYIFNWVLRTLYITGKNPFSKPFLWVGHQFSVPVDTIWILAKFPRGIYFINLCILTQTNFSSALDCQFGYECQCQSMALYVSLSL